HFLIKNIIEIKALLLYLIPLFFISNAVAQENCTSVGENFGNERLYPNYEILVGKADPKSIEEAITLDDNFAPITTTQPDLSENSHWLKFSLCNSSTRDRDLHLSFTFSDSIEFYAIRKNDGHIHKIVTGDVLALNKRPVRNGQMAFVPFTINSNSSFTCYVRLTGFSKISKQFKKVTLQSVKIYSHEKYVAEFESPRIYQAFFYGAIFIMLVFNLLIFISTRSYGYLYYVFFLVSLAIFFLSNNGYLLEFIWPSHPSYDLYLRFLSTPIMMVAYLLFSKKFLQTSAHATRYDTLINCFIVSFVGVVLLMISGHWLWSRGLVILLSLASFVLIFVAALKIVSKGYRPAQYFLIGNVLLILAGVVYAGERLMHVIPGTSTQYIIQVFVLLQIALFSIGLADRINVVQKDLNDKVLENERLAKEREIERSALIQEKNRELEKSNKELEAFMYKTAHDIRGPIARLMGLCKIGLLDVQDVVGREYLHRFEVDADYLNEIIIRLSKVYEISNHKVSIGAIDLDHFTQFIQSASEIKDGKVKCNILIPAHIQVISDPKLLNFIAENLIENAIKYKKPAEGNIPTVEVEIVSLNQTLVLSIRDNGQGILKEEEGEIFQMFSKAATKHKTPGLGLYMVKMSVEKLRGK
ncbi:MAG TPA: sensor histidine kinase, partial [Cytophagaceae bacterium]